MNEMLTLLAQTQEGQPAGSIFVILDSLHEPDPIPLWTEDGWAKQMIPLYYQTPMKSILKASPWLLELEVAKGGEIAAWVDNQQAAPWGWAYTSALPWPAQVQHWRNHLRILIDGQLRAVRLQDPRVLGLWLQQGDMALWQGLLAPVTTLRLPNQDVYSRPVEARPIETPLPWALPPELSTAWHHSRYGLKVKASNLEHQLWEQNGELAEALYQHGGELDLQLEAWLAQQIELGVQAQVLGLTEAINWARYQTNEVNKA